jgi:cytoskeletal protein CcmA (bactofilin family)
MVKLQPGSKNPERPVSSSFISKNPGISIISVGMRVVGQVETDGVLKIEGRVEGNIRSEGQVLVAKGGLVEGDIFTREAVLGGAIKGAIAADKRVEVQSTSVITGDITSPKITVQEGGEVNGVVRTVDPQALARPKASEDDGFEAERSPDGHRAEGKVQPGAAPEGRPAGRDSREERGPALAS